MNDVIDPSAELPPIVSKFLSGDAPPLSREDVDGIYSAALRLYGRERWSEAGDVFRFLVLTQPEQARVWIGLAACHEALGDDDYAIALYEVACNATTPNPHRTRARLHLARLLVRLGRHDDARTELDALEAESIEPDEAIDAYAAELRRCLMDTVPSMETA
jgi:Flp pilus assembly protein TadD